MKARPAGSLGEALRAVIYARCSTDHQDTSIATQTTEATRYIESKGWIVANVFTDEALSRAEYVKRPALYAMLNAAERGEFDVIVMRDVDRLGGDTNRNGVILSDLIDRGIRIDEYLTQNTVRLDNAISKFFAVAKNFAAEIEREKTSQRTHEALRVKAARGLNVGGRCFGYENRRVFEGEKHVATEYVIDAQQAEVVRLIFALFIKGLGNRAIAKELNAREIPAPHAGKRGTGSWSPSVVWGMVRNERYRGILIYGKTKKGYRIGTKVRTRREDHEVQRAERPDLRIISEATWADAQARIAAKTKPWHGRRGPKPQNLATGLAVCTCGGGIKVGTRKNGTKPQKIYHCGYHHDRGEAVCPHALRRPVEEIDERLLSWIETNLLQERIVERVLAEVRRRIGARSASNSAEIRALDEQLAKLRREIGNLSEAIAMAKGTLPTLVEKLAARQAEATKLTARLEILKTAPDALATECKRLEDDALERIRDLRGVLRRNPERAREALEALLVDKLQFIPVDTPAGKRYEVVGRLAIGGLLRLPAGSRLIASPGGFEPPLAT